MLTPESLPDLNNISEPTLIPEPINLEHEPPILENHISLMENECEPLLFDLDPTLELKSTLEPRLDLNQLPESVLVLVHFILQPKSTISTNLILLLDQDIRHYDFKMIFQD